MVVTNARLEMARRAAAMSGGVRRVTSVSDVLSQRNSPPQYGSYTPASQRQRSAGTIYNLRGVASERFRDADMRRQALDVANGHQREEGGMKGFLASVLTNPITKVITAPLNVLDFGRRAVISGIHEISDAIGSGDASWDDFWKQAKDPTYGVGRYVKGQGKWGNRLIGFLGDVVADPLTYVTFGASKFAGSSGRIALAAKAAASGIESGERLAQIARFGRVAMTAEEVAQVGVKQAGIYFLGKRIPLAGSSEFVQIAEKRLASARLWLGDRGMMKALQRGFTPSVQRTARLMLARGEVPEGQVGHFIQALVSRDTERTVINMTKMQNEVRLHQVLKSIPEDARHTVHEILEGVRPIEAATASERAAAEAIRPFYDDLHKMVYEAMAKADPTTQMRPLKDYYTHVLAPEARKEMAKGDDTFGRSFSYLVDSEDPMDVFKERKLATLVYEGKKVDWFGTILTKNDLSVKRLNELARRGGFKGNVFETDIRNVLTHYIDQHAQQMGKAARWKHMVDSGAFNEWERRGVASTLVDEDAVAAQVARVRTAANVVTESGEKFQKTAHEMRKRLATAVRAAKKGDTTALVPVAEHVENLAATVAELGTVRDAVKEALGTELGSAGEPLLATVDEMARHLEELHGQIKQVLGSGDLSTVEQLTKRSDELSQRVAALSASQDAQIEFNDLLAHNWEKVVDGTPSGVAEVDRIAATLGLLPQSSGAERMAQRKAATGGGFQAFVEHADLSWWDRVSGEGVAPLRRSNVGRVTRSMAEQRLASGNLGSVSVTDLREVGAWLLARHEKTVGDGALGGLRTELTDVLERAAISDDLLNRAADKALEGVRGEVATSHRVTDSELLLIQSAAGADMETWTKLQAALQGHGTLDGEPVKLTDEVKLNLANAMAEIEGKTYNIGGRKSVTGKTFTFSEAQTVLTRKSVRQWTPIDAAALEKLGSASSIKAELQDALQQYLVVGDAHQRFVLAARQMAPLGGIPTEAMFTEAMRAAGKRVAERWDARVAELSHAYTVAQEVLETFKGSLDAGVQPSRAIRSAIDEAIANDATGTFQRVAGPLIAAHEDVKTMLARAKSPKYVDEVIRPWFEVHYGPWRGKETAISFLRDAKKNGALPSPFSEGAAAETVFAFFARLLGGERRNIGDTLSRGGTTATSTLTARRVEGGSLIAEWQRALDQQLIFARLGEADMDAVVRAGKSGSIVADSLRDAAKSIEDAIPGGGSVEAARKAAIDVQAAKANDVVEVALADQRLADGMTELARYDLHNVSGIDGQPGFWLPDGAVVLDADGQPLRFSRAEGEALFRGEQPEFQLQHLMSVKGKVEADVLEAQKMYERSLAKYGADHDVTRQIAAEARRREDALKEVIFNMEVALPETQASALRKARLLVDPENGAPWHLAGVGKDSALHPHPEGVAGRQSRLAAAHADSPSRKILNRLDELQGVVHDNLFNDWLNNRAAVESQVGRLREAAETIDKVVVSGELVGLQAEREAIAAALPLAKEAEAVQASMTQMLEEVEKALPQPVPSPEATALNEAAGVAAGDLAVKFESTAAIANGAPLNEGTFERLRSMLNEGEQFFTKDRKLRKKGMGFEMRNELRQWMVKSEAELLASGDNPTLAAIFRDAINREADLVYDEHWAAEAQGLLDVFEKGTVRWDEVPVKLANGIASLETLGLPGLTASQEVADIFINFHKLQQPAFARTVNRFFGQYTKFFKTYAVFTPGFHVRNILSNTFAMIASGTSPVAMAKGFGLWRSLRQHMIGGGTFDAWLEALPSAERGFAEIAAKTMWASDSGFTSNQLAKIVGREESRLTDNAATRGMRKIGEYYETSSRFMLAYGAATDGLDYHGATALVKRYLFDYRDISTADQNIQAIVPFWIWMSRNFPMQLVNQWANPRAYAMYGHLVRNFQVPVGPDQVVPSYITEGGGWQVTEGGGFLTPDLGFNRLGETMSEATDPMRLMSYVNPAFRLPIELAGKRQLYNDVPFPDTDQPLEASFLTEPLGTLMEAFGVGSRNRSGDVIVDPRINYGLRNILPPLAQAERLVPSTERGQDRQANSILGYLGIPFKQVTKGMEESEIRRRKAVLMDMITEEKQLRK